MAGTLHENTGYSPINGIVTPATGINVAASCQVDNIGNTLRTADAGDGTSFMGGALTLATFPSAAYTTASSPVTFSTAGLTLMAIDVTVTSFSGGSSPTVQFFLDRLGVDSVYYTVWTSQSLNAAGANSVSIGPGFGSAFSGPVGVQYGVFTAFGRFRWVYTGSPTSVTFSASVVGR